MADQYVLMIFLSIRWKGIMESLWVRLGQKGLKSASWICFKNLSQVICSDRQWLQLCQNKMASKTLTQGRRTFLVEDRRWGAWERACKTSTCRTMLSGGGQEQLATYSLQVDMSQAGQVKDGVFQWLLHILPENIFLWGSMLQVKQQSIQKTSHKTRLLRRLAHEVQSKVRAEVQMFRKGRVKQNIQGFVCSMTTSAWTQWLGLPERWNICWHCGGWLEDVGSHWSVNNKGMVTRRRTSIGRSTCLLEA